MADYSGAYERNCKCRRSVFSNHATWCPDNPLKEYYDAAKENNLRVVTLEEGRFFGHYECLNGCGMLVWNPQQHMRFVHERFG